MLKVCVMQRMEMNDREFKEWADNVARKKGSVNILMGLFKKQTIIKY